MRRAERAEARGGWRGQVTRNGAPTTVALDFQGNVFSGAAGRDGTPGNPPSTTAGRAVDRAQGQAPQPDGMPGNPAGTAAGRAVDRALGDTTGANPGAGNAPSR